MDSTRDPQAQAQAPLTPDPRQRSLRLPALDWLRGLVMILMTIDHAAGSFNAGHLVTDSAFMYRPGTPLPMAQFLTRWITHLCAPTFVFLAGAALSLSCEKRQAAGEPARAIDRFILQRGLLLALLDPLWMTWVLIPGRLLLQVLYAIGLSLVCMVPLRRLGRRALLCAGLSLVLGGELLVGLVRAVSGGAAPWPLGLLLTGGLYGKTIIGYPFVPWLGIMMLGWSLGRYLPALPPGRLARLLALVGVAALGVFGVVRGLNQYGNMGLLRDDGSLVQWLHVSKYPPSLSFTALELGLSLLLLAAFVALARREGPAPRWTRPLLVLGQTALFYYLLHVHLLQAAAWILGWQHRGGLGATYLASAAVLVVLYPLCVLYRRYKQTHPDGWTRYI